VAFSDWLLSDLRLPKGVASEAEARYPWWRVMCLTGVDYFSTLSYQPGIAFLAAGFLSPIATLILVLVTLLGALPVYGLVAKASPNGQGSIAMLEQLFPQWAGKAFVLILLGFATTDFIITITLSAADAAAHLVQNPFVPAGMRSQMGVTLVLLAILGGIFLKGFKEAIGVAVILVVLYLGLSAIITVTGFQQIMLHPQFLFSWKAALFTGHGSVLTMFGVCFLLFPKLALGLSGFETGVALMPLIRGDDLPHRIRNARKLLITAASIMSVFLLATSLVTTMLIAPADFGNGGQANGRALAFLAHQYLGPVFGTVYDLTSILILAFAGASAMAGLLNLIPRYLPRFGMAPEWARASRPLVLVFLTIAILVTLIFHANVDEQGGAYATGVLVLITSAAIAVTLNLRRSLLLFPFLLISLLFVYTTAINAYERPDGVRISSVFIICIVLVSFISRAFRSTELRITGIEFDEAAAEMLTEAHGQVVRLIARKPRNRENAEYLDQVARSVQFDHNFPDDAAVFFLEVERGDVSSFEATVRISGERVGRHCVLRAVSPVVANSIAAALIDICRLTEQIPHGYFGWSEASPMANFFRFIFLGEGDTAPLVHEVLRRAVPEPSRRPIIHVS
jgi:hypothetical protein